MASKEKYRALLSSASKTAGSDNWKTSTGRTDGPDGFVGGDAWRLFKLRFKTTRLPEVCPVCMDKPNSADDWYVTKSCKHAVCRECLQDYSSALINDPNHSGSLKCPCCPRLLRVEDAKVALDKRPGVKETKAVSMRNVAPKSVMKRVSSKLQAKGGLFDEPDAPINNSALDDLEKWDAKTRDEMLRSMTDFRPCPHCEVGTAGARDDLSPTGKIVANITESKGGGFVTPECLSPINEERESNAESLMRMAGNPSAIAALLVYAIYYSYCTAGPAESNGGKISAALQIALAVTPSLFLPILPHAIRLLLATMARREIMRPIVVACPCCLKEFNLEASSELHSGASSDDASEVATQRWKSSHTRPCPGCASPIMKDGGCNHVKCGKCRADFCWACMRAKSRCQAYKCNNGAPFGNAFGDGSLVAVRAGLVALEQDRQAGSSVVEQIDHVEASAMRHLRLAQNFPVRYVALTGIICMGPSAIWIAVRRILSLVITYLCSPVTLAMVVIIYSLASYYGTREFNWRATFRRPDFRTEEEQLTEAISRSFAEQ